MEEVGISLKDQVEQIGAVYEQVNPNTGEVEQKYRMGTKLFFEHSDYPIRVFRLKPDENFFIHTKDIPWAIRADDSDDVVAWLIRLRMNHIEKKNGTFPKFPLVV